MLEDAVGIHRVVLACDRRFEEKHQRTSMIIGGKFNQNPFEKETLFLFCGRKSDRMKGLLWMENGFLLFVYAGI